MMPVKTKVVIEKELVAMTDERNKLKKQNTALEENAQKNQEKIKELDDAAAENEEKITKLETDFKELKTENKTLKKKVDANETKRLAESYEKVSDIYEKKCSSHVKYISGMIFIILILGGGYFFIDIKNNYDWATKLNFLSFYGVLVFVLYFLVRQYSFYRNLFVDMRHRQTLAQGYYNILRSVEDESILPQLSEKTIDFLTTPPHVREDDMGTPVDLLKKLMDKASS